MSDQQLTNIQLMLSRVSRMTDEELSIVWFSLPYELFAEEQTMTEWTEILYSELSRRGLSALRS